ncbi:MAG TPA: chemotaxis protein CheB [Bryobacteraceae bacterium]|nr:chemotaxis protein CheB [Bryobacteraceae bacterium]
MAANHKTAVRDIVVIGASAGGVTALKSFVGMLPTDLPAALFITLHLSGRSDTVLAEILNSTSSLPANWAVDDEPIMPGRIYLAPPDAHLLLSSGHIKLGRGPRENLQRPCINVMFRSAAVAYGPRVVGVVLTGLLDDGASGLWEIQQQGGVTVVQDPNDAAYRSMPESAIRGGCVDYIVKLAELELLLSGLVRGECLLTERHDIAGEPTMSAGGQTCPECGGAMEKVHFAGLWEYRCHIGHRLGLKSMVAGKTKLVEQAIAVALSQIEELTQLLEQLKDSPDSQTRNALVEEIDLRREQARQLRQLLEQDRELATATSPK